MGSHRPNLDTFSPKRINVTNPTGVSELIMAVINRAQLDYARPHKAFMEGGGGCIKEARDFLFGSHKGSLEDFVATTRWHIDVEAVRDRAIILQERQQRRVAYRQRQSAQIWFNRIGKIKWRLRQALATGKPYFFIRSLAIET